MEKKLVQLIIKEIVKRKISNEKALASLKRRAAKKFKKRIFSNFELLEAYRQLLKKKQIKKINFLESLLRIRKIRSLSGIAVVSVLTKPYPCPGNCLYCPTQKGIPKSYLDNEPAVMRAVLNGFDPYKQTKMRLRALKNIGHPTDKIELIVIGGTWSFLPKKYQTWFIKRCFDACNNKNSQTLQGAQKLNEKAKNRIVGLTLETRPDFISTSEIKRMRKLGATRVEIGVQSLYNDILKLNKRGHKIKETIKATQLLKDAGFKICYHMMPNLPGSNIPRDKKMFEKLWSSIDFRPDLLKIYPCALLKEAPLYRLWQKKKYKPYSDSQLINLLKEIKKKIPYYCRIQRLVRDIPSSSIVTGPTKISNLRQILAGKSKKEGWKCKCIRCREVRENYNPKEKLFLFRQNYDASGGKEMFLSFEDKKRKRLYSLLRLRVPSFALRTPAFAKASADKSGGKSSQGKHFIVTLRDAAIIREVHTYGQLVPISERGIAPQHRGLGKKLIKKAEKIAKEEFGFHPVKSTKGGTTQFNGVNKMAVISGVGVRDYYRKLGYELKNEYMIKELKRTL